MTISSATSGSTKITPIFSIFLDGIRLIAALTVLFSHARYTWFPSQRSVSTDAFNGAHAAVITFFVLSGYVIAHTTNTSNRGRLRYAQARLSRLCSVLYPALIITAGIEIVVTQISPVLASEHIVSPSWARYILSAGFLNEAWFLSAAPKMNVPLWSLSFEFWYYVIFGTWFFRGAGAKSFFLPLLSCLIAGPKILLMMPIWLFGYFSYRIKLPDISRVASLNLMIFSFVICIAVSIVVPPYPLPLGEPPFFFADRFLTDWLIGIFFAVGLAFFPKNADIAVNKKIQSIFRKLADLTFPIYILHFPLLILWQAVFPVKLNSRIQMSLAITSVIIVSAIIGFFLESRRHYWNNFFKWLLVHIKFYFDYFLRAKLSARDN